MTFSEIIKRISGAQCNGIGAPVMLVIILATRCMVVVPLAPFMLGSLMPR